MSNHFITKHLDLWTGAVTRKTNGRGRQPANGQAGGSYELTGIQKLRELILELAVRGKLVEQDPSDEPASELLKRIEEEKQRLADEGKIKKPKKLPEVTEEEKPYEVPEGWEWTCISNLGRIVGGGTPKSKVPEYWTDDGIKWLTPADLYNYNEKYINSGRRDISQKGLDNSSAQLMPAGSVLFSSRAPIGYVAIAGNEISTNQGFKSCVPFIAGLSEYIYYFLKRSAKEIDRLASGTTFKEISGSKLAKIQIPLPPLPEQHRIAQKVDELMALCDRLEQQTADQLAAHETLVDTLLDTLTRSADAAELAENWSRLEAHFDTLFTTEHSIDRLKETILQLAVMGKLVPQVPEEEPASELLKRIEEEKQRLVDEGKIKKPKKLAEVAEEEKPFEVPEGWEWSRLGNITQKIGSGATPRGGKSNYKSSGIPFLRSQNIWNDGLYLDDVAYISTEIHEKMSNTHVYANDILLNITGASLGRCTIVPPEVSEANVSQHVSIIRIIKPVNRDFLHKAILSPYIQSLVWGRQVGMAREGLSKKVLEQFEIPIPPLAEQHRIVQKVDELMALCDLLKARLDEVGELREQLAETIVEAGVG